MTCWSSRLGLCTLTLCFNSYELNHTWTNRVSHLPSAISSAISKNKQTNNRKNRLTNKKDTALLLNQTYSLYFCYLILQLNSDSMDSKVTGQISPSLVITTDDNLVTSSHVVGFGPTLVEMQGEGVLKRGLRSLMATYYILDFEYPPGYSMMLKLIQHYLMGRVVKDLPKSIKTLRAKAGVANSWTFLECVSLKVSTWSKFGREHLLNQLSRTLHV